MHKIDGSSGKFDEELAEYRLVTELSAQGEHRKPNLHPKKWAFHYLEAKISRTRSTRNKKEVPLI